MTLIELVISMAVASIIGLTVLISLSILDRRNLESAARNLVSNLLGVKELVISGEGQHNYLVAFDMANNSYAVYEDLDDGFDADANERRETVPLRPVDLTSFTDFSSAAVSPEILVFHKPDSTNSAIILDTSGDALDVLITLTHANKTKVVKVFSRTGYARLD